MRSSEPQIWQQWSVTSASPLANGEISSPRCVGFDVQSLLFGSSLQGQEIFEVCAPVHFSVFIFWFACVGMTLFPPGFFLTAIHRENLPNESRYCVNPALLYCVDFSACLAYRLPVSDGDDYDDDEESSTENTPKKPDEPKMPEFLEHVVTEEDTLTGICMRYKVSSCVSLLSIWPENSNQPGGCYLLVGRSWHLVSQHFECSKTFWADWS